LSATPKKMESEKLILKPIQILDWRIVLYLQTEVFEVATKKKAAKPKAKAASKKKAKKK